MFSVYFLSMLGGMIIAHELGHLWAFKRITGKRPRLFWSWRGLKVGSIKDGDYEKLTEEQYRAIIYIGVGTGFLFEICLLPFLFSEDIAILLGAVYLFGCKEDLLMLLHSYRREFGVRWWSRMMR
ncbi:MAG: hypothetical protein QW165_04510 [Candidatus Woesearchaeota archaeon]